MSDARRPVSSFPAASRALDRLLTRARAALLAERAWRAVVPLFLIIAGFLALSWSGLWLRVEPVWRIVGTGVFAMLALAALWPAR
ncbi:MAG: DUF4175 family protein, partial [Beijerinckiaceae bacterium]